MNEIKITIDTIGDPVSMIVFPLKATTLIDHVFDLTDEKVLFRAFCGHASVTMAAERLNSIELYMAFKAWMYGNYTGGVDVRFATEADHEEERAAMEAADDAWRAAGCPEDD